MARTRKQGRQQQKGGRASTQAHAQNQVYSGGGCDAQSNIHERAPIKDRHRQEICRQASDSQANSACNLQTEEEIKHRHEIAHGYEDRGYEETNTEEDSERGITRWKEGIRRVFMRSHRMKNNTPILTVPAFRADNGGMQTSSDRRDGDRLLCAELVQIIWQDEAGRERRRVANLEDISLSGICLQVESPIAAGTAIAIQYGDGELLGTIRYCRFQDSGYFLGVELVEGSRWSTQHYKPEHLLDPSDLVDQSMLRRQTEKAKAN
jgi:hypothetical protein